MIDFIQNQWDMILCPQKRHKTLLTKICIDARCNAATEQYQLICDKCIAENETHQNAQTQHKTIELDAALTGLVKTVFSELSTYAKSQSKTNSLSTLEEYQEKLSGCLQRLKYVDQQIQAHIKYIECSISCVSQQISEETNKTEQLNGNIKTIISEILKSQTLSVAQDAINKLRACTQIIEDSTQLEIKVPNMDETY